MCGTKPVHGFQLPWGQRLYTLVHYCICHRKYSEKGNQCKSDGCVGLITYVSSFQASLPRHRLVARKPGYKAILGGPSPRFWSKDPTCKTQKETKRSQTDGCWQPIAQHHFRWNAKRSAGIAVRRMTGKFRLQVPANVVSRNDKELRFYCMVDHIRHVAVRDISFCSTLQGGHSSGENQPRPKQLIRWIWPQFNNGWTSKQGLFPYAETADTSCSI